MIMQRNKKTGKKEVKDLNNTQSSKQKENEIKEKGQLPITRNENRKRKDISENKQNKINKRIKQCNKTTKKKTRQSKKIKKIH